MIYYTTKLVPTTIFLFLIALTIYLLIDSAEKNFLHYLFCGIVIGFAGLCDPVALVLYPVLLSWFLVFRKINFFGLCLIIVVSVITLIPWTIRNYRIHKTIVPITTQFSINFWIGNNLNATGTDYYKIESIENGTYMLMTHTLPSIIQDSISKLSEIDRAGYFFAEAMGFIRKNPRKFIGLLIKKLYYYWWFAPASEYSSIDVRRYRPLLVVAYAPALILGLLGMLFSIKNRRPIFLVMAYIICVSALYIFTHVGLIRYRMPVETYLLMFCAYSIKTLRR